MRADVTVKENHIFRRIYQKGKSAVSGAMVLYCRPNGRKKNRLGVAASTKIGGAVVRNRAKRRLREVYQLNAAHLKTGYDVILVARGRTAVCRWDELTRSFLKLAKKAGLAREGETP